MTFTICLPAYFIHKDRTFLEKTNSFLFCSKTDDKDIISNAGQILHQEISNEDGEFRDETVDVKSIVIAGWAKT